MSSELAGKVAIVTGGASGIGRAGFAALLGAGATVAALDRDEGGVNAVVSDGKKLGGKAFALVADLADMKRIPEAVAKVLEQLGRIDILVNCAGVTGKFQTLLEIDDENWVRSQCKPEGAHASDAACRASHDRSRRGPPHH